MTGSIRLSERIAEIRAAANKAGAARHDLDAARGTGDVAAIVTAFDTYHSAKERLVKLAEALETDGVAEFLEAWITLEEELRGLRFPEKPKAASKPSDFGL